MHKVHLNYKSYRDYPSSVRLPLYLHLTMHTLLRYVVTLVDNRQGPASCGIEVMGQFRGSLMSNSVSCGFQQT